MTLWFDFTTTSRSSGPSGIGNVEANIGRALLAMRPDVRCFAVIDGDAVELDPTVELPSPPSEPLVPAAESRTLGDAVRARLVHHLGSLAHPVVRGLSTVNQARSRALNRLRRRRGGVERRRLEGALAPDDIVISVGAVWSGEVADELLAVKRRHGCRVVMMVYDLIPLTHTHLAFNKDTEIFVDYYSDLVAAADLITCISRQSERDLKAFADEHQLDLPPTAVLRLGDGNASASQHADEPEERGDFFLCVGTIERRKNHEVVYDALRILESEGARLPTVVLVGADGWGTRDLLAELRLQSTSAARSMVVIGALDDGAIEGLYRRARALLFPSHFEGWGLPIREAAIRGCPVAAGDSPAVREAGQGIPGIRYLNPDDPAAWADYLREPGQPFDPLTPFTWHDSAAQLLEHVDAHLGAQHGLVVADGNG